MPYNNIAQETEGLGQLSSMEGGAEPMGMEQQAPVGQQAPSQPPGGPGIDTPQEQQAVQLLMQGALLMRRATEIEPSIRYIIDDLLQKAYLGVTKHYGMEQEGKLALQQSQLQANRGRSAALMGPPKQGAQQQPPTGDMGI